MKPDIYIGIDPDISKSGWATWDTQKKEFREMCNVSFWVMIDCLSGTLNPDGYSYHVILEAGWLNQKSNFHGRKGQTKATGERIAKNVGENHAVGKLIEQYLIKSKIEYTLVKPTTKKLNAESFKRLTKWEGRTNQEERDAALLVWDR